MSSRRARSGFSLVEALVAVALVGGGIASVVTALGATDRTEAKVLGAERLQRLAQQKLDEIVATEDYNTTSGDFSDEGANGFEWTMTDDPSGVENLDTITVTVDKSNGTGGSQTVSTLVYRSPASTGTTLGGGQ
jgi:type II secretory pathway pseudopilin PulG